MRSYRCSAEGAVAKRFLNAERNFASEAESESPPQPLAAIAIALRPATAMAFGDIRHALLKGGPVLRGSAVARGLWSGNLIRRLAGRLHHVRNPRGSGGKVLFRALVPPAPTPRD